jgi:hypothetical protein
MVSLSVYTGRNSKHSVWVPIYATFAELFDVLRERGICSAGPLRATSGAHVITEATPVSVVFAESGVRVDEYEGI